MLLRKLKNILLGRHSSAETSGEHLLFPESGLAHRYLDGLKGLEIGPSSHNPFGLNTRNVGRIDAIYEAEQRRFGNPVAPIHIEACADAIPVPDESEDFILSSHVIEHCPDLLKAFYEWFRIIKPGGLLFTITPHRDASGADREKPLTTWDHVASDFRTGITPEMEPEAGRFGHCHYHVFELERMQSFFDRFFGERLELIDAREKDDKVGNGFTLVHKKRVPLEHAHPWHIMLGEERISVTDKVRPSTGPLTRAAGF